jgi:hypothetical protein
MRKKKKSFEDVRKWQRYHFFGSAVVTVPKEKGVIDATIANISFSGIGLYSSQPIGKGKRVNIRISFLDKAGKVQEDTVSGKVDWQKKFKNMYLTGVIFDEEPNILNQPRLVEHLTWLIDTYNLPQPYKDKRIAML